MSSLYVYMWEFCVSLVLSVYECMRMCEWLNEICTLPVSLPCPHPVCVLTCYFIPCSLHFASALSSLSFDSAALLVLWLFLWNWNYTSPNMLEHAVQRRLILPLNPP